MTRSDEARPDELSPQGETLDDDVLAEVTGGAAAPPRDGAPLLDGIV